MHLYDQQQHDEKCRDTHCVSKCGFRRLNSLLEAPLMPWDQREAALLRGDI